jgi:anti-sigma factor RsiW
MNRHEIVCPLIAEPNGIQMDLLLEYSAGRLDPAQSAALERHMAVCGGCAAFRAEQGALWSVLDEWEPEPVSLDFNRRLWQRLDGSAAAPWFRRFAHAWRYGAWKPAIPLAAAVLVVTTAFMMDHRESATIRSAGGSSAGASVVEVEQVERALDDIQLLKQFDTTVTEAGSSKTM